MKQTGIGIAGVALLKSDTLARSRSQPEQVVTAIPPHREIQLQGVHAYADRTSVAAGEKINFHISNAVPCRLSVCRLGPEVDLPGSDEILKEFDEIAPAPQPIHPGSYIFVEQGLKKIKALTLECWVRAWKTDAVAGLITQYDFDRNCGFGLFIKPNGRISFYLGDGRAFDGANSHFTSEGKIQPHRWHHVVATWNGKEKLIWLDGKRIGRAPFPYPIAGGRSSLRLAASAEKGLSTNFFDGDMAMTAIYSRALTAEEIKARVQQRALVSAKGKDVWACWNFAEEKGERLADVSGNERHGRIINHATWMIGGPSSNYEVIRFADYEPQKDTERGHALRFASDDLYDCRWKATQEFKVPENARPGFYVGRLRYDMSGTQRLYHVTFIVKKPAQRAKAPILLLAATNTWRAYSATPFADTDVNLKRVATTHGLANSPKDAPAYSFFRGHAAGQGCYQLGTRMPFVGADPYLVYGIEADYSHLARAERFTQTWLEKSGYDYDVITDYDLHRDPEILRDYRAVIISGHSEYWSIPMYEGLQKHLQNGGNIAVLSGNSLFWRVSFSEDGNILECRKVDAPGNQMQPVHRGECWHEHDSRRGGLLRDCGYPGWKLIGLETLGWTGVVDLRMFGPYIAELTDHFLFNQPETVDLKFGDTFGKSETGAGPLANGHEVDVRVSTLAALQQEYTPPGASLPTEPPGMVRIANGIIPWDIGGSAFDYFFRAIKPGNRQGGEMIYWERPDGGKVFNAGSIGAGWALSVDPKFQTLMRNVLFHFGASPVKK